MSGYTQFQRAFQESCDSLRPPVPCLLPKDLSGLKVSAGALYAAITAMVDIVKELPRTATFKDFLAAAITRGNATVTTYLYKIPGVLQWANGQVWAAKYRVPPAFGTAASIAKVFAELYAAYVVGAWVGAFLYAFNETTGANDIIRAPIANFYSDYYAAGGIFNMMAGVHQAERDGDDARHKLAMMRKMKQNAQQAGLQIPPSIAAKLPRGI